jgi:hypothetical protein
LVEQLTFNQLVAGSNPAAPTKFIKDNFMTFFIVFLFCFGLFIPLSILYRIFNMIINQYIKKRRSDNLEYWADKICYEKEINERHEWDKIYKLDY